VLEQFDWVKAAEAAAKVENPNELAVKPLATMPLPEPTFFVGPGPAQFSMPSQAERALGYLRELLLRPGHPEMHLRQLKTGGFVAGIELPRERYMNATGDTLEAAILKLAGRLSEEKT
jgi:hypothetical protein